MCSRSSSNGFRCRATRRCRRGFGPWLENLILPAIALGCVYIALIARITRASMLEVLQQDYIRTARAKGMGQGGILFVHALKNAAVPIVTVIGIGIALLIGGAVVTESVFAIPGLGRLTVDAILRRDYPVIQGIVLLFSFVYVLVNLVVDLALHPARPEDPVLSAQSVNTRGAARRRRRAGDAGRAAADQGAARPCRASSTAIPTIAFGGALLIVMLLIAVLAPCSAPSIPPRSRPPAHAQPFGRLLVRHRHAGPRHLFARALRRAGVADRRLLGRHPGLARRAGRSASSPASCAGPTASSCA